MEKNKHEIKLLHARYIIGILIGVLIIVIAQSFFTLPQFVEKMTFALTMSSMVLSLFAIFYAINFNSTQMGQMLRLEEVQENIQESTGNLRLLTEEFREEVIKIPNSIAQLREDVKTIQVKLDSDEKTEITNSIPEKERKKYEILPIFNLFINSSFPGMGLLYMACKHKKNNLDIDIVDIVEVFPEMESKFLAGFIGGMSAFGLVSIDLKETSVVVKKVNQVLYNSIEDWMKILIKTIKDDTIRFKAIYEIVNRIDKIVTKRIEERIS